MQSRVHKSIDELDPLQWNALGADRNPFPARARAARWDWATRPEKW